MHPRSRTRALRIARRIALAGAALGLLALGGCASIRPSWAVDESAGRSGPARVETDVAAAAAGEAGEPLPAVWLKGHYAYVDGSYVWVPGRWWYGSR
jgi:hypothetical protein